MFSFLKKIFGTNDKKQAFLIVDDEFLEMVVLLPKNKSSKVDCIKKAPLPKGVVERGNIISESAFQKVFNDLCISQNDTSEIGHLTVLIPFEQIYPFAKQYSLHVADEVMKFDLIESMEAELPFEMDDLVVKYELKKSTEHQIYSAAVYSSSWNGRLQEACNELGFYEIEFVSKASFENNVIKKNFASENKGQHAMFSFSNERLFLSFFHDNILCDSFELNVDLNDDDKEKMAIGIAKEYEAASQQFLQNFKHKIEQVYWVNAPDDIYSLWLEKAGALSLNSVVVDQQKINLPSEMTVDEYSTAILGCIDAK